MYKIISTQNAFLVCAKPSTNTVRPIRYRILYIFYQYVFCHFFVFLGVYLLAPETIQIFIT